MSTGKKIALGMMVTAAVRMVAGKHDNCAADSHGCVVLEDLKLTALAYVLETLRAIAAKRIDADRKPGQASCASLIEVIEELRVAIGTLNSERLQRTDDHGATQAPGQA